MIPRWKGDANVKYIAHDRDSKISKCIRDSGWEVEQIMDPNHTKKSLERQWKKMNDKQKGLLHGLKQRLFSWFSFVSKKEISPAHKTEMWENASQHYCGNHSNCIDPNHSGFKWTNASNPEAQATLNNFISKGTNLLTSVKPSAGSTQANESFHAVKAKFADKRVNYPLSTPARFAISTISSNNQPGWEDDLRHYLGISPIPTEFQNALRDQSLNKQRLSEQKCSEQYRSLTNHYRDYQRWQINTNTQGQNDYKMPHRRK
jgi:hypothetical protein